MIGLQYSKGGYHKSCVQQEFWRTEDKSYVMFFL